MNGETKKKGWVERNYFSQMLLIQVNLASMGRILQFEHISDFVRTLNLEVNKKASDFLVFNYEQANFANYHMPAAYRQNYFEINLDLTAGCSTQVDQFTLPSKANRLTLISPHRLQKMAQDHEAMDTPHKGYSIFFTRDFINAEYCNERFQQDFPFFSTLNAPFLLTGEQEAGDFVDIIAKIQYEYDNFGAFSKEIIRNYLNILLLKAKKQYNSLAVPSSLTSREREIYHDFELLVQKHFMELHTVRAYADLMYMSPKHMSETVKKVTGYSALQVIHRAQLGHAKAQLQQTSKSISEIAQELNFENTDYFSVFFRRLTGKPPLQFRTS